jgi:hypothetical protein
MPLHPDGPINLTQRMKHRLSHPTQMEVKAFDVKIAENEPVLGLQVERVRGDTFIIPISFGTAKDLANMMLQTLMYHAPEMFFSPDVVQKLRAGELSLEQLKELV